ncbi:MAG: bifunctional diaminohydroxyphosphoribosylaminopyrimidine deaminase/5-amino-6-(5-phosphoribosylamino)uracil reductase RibD [Endozoicomonas sp. (ex Botrylloides leachii)]|nr:bifunctional diaminohydroxyphosphoribosylaminopyrimidine deaminase/5-amino-6-(5-phosphoribosylamino)uracil reductase RibD [Endozoicomonas sp. (ex Botrylloides leachii)]
MSKFSADDHLYMARAIQLADLGTYTTMPNPRVGCVITNGEQVVGEGWHQWAGEVHAEIQALNQAGLKAKGATAYISLEPCAHWGKTPPCVNALITAGIARVVAATEDPNPLVAGRGLAMLTKAGIDTASGLLASQAQLINSGFIKRMLTGKPMVRAKLAMSVDGRTAMASGESKWITGADARSDVQRLRASSCAIVTGVESIIKDNSSLTLRLEDMKMAGAEQIINRQPLRVVLDSQLRTPPSAKVITGPGQCLIVCTKKADVQRKKALEHAGAEVLVQDTHKEQVCCSLLLDELGNRACNEVLLETGATLAGTMLQEDLIDELIIFMAPVLMGNKARELFQLPFDNMSEKRQLSITDIRAIGNDWRITAKPM